MGACPSGTRLEVVCRMRSLAPHDRPREKLERFGAAVLGDNELLAVVLGHGTPGSSALDVANGVAGGVHGLTRLVDGQLRDVTGIGAAQAARVAAAIELGRRTLARPPAERPQLASPRAAAGYLLPVYGAGAVERFGVVLLDSKHRVLRTAVLSVGTARRQSGPSARGVPGGGVGGRGGHRHVSQSPVG